MGFMLFLEWESLGIGISVLEMCKVKIAVWENVLKELKLKPLLTQRSLTCRRLGLLL